MQNNPRCSGPSLTVQWQRVTVGGQLAAGARAATALLGAQEAFAPPHWAGAPSAAGLDKSGEVQRSKGQRHPPSLA